MNPELRGRLRLAAPNMPPEVAWPLVDECKQYATMEQVPASVLRLIDQYMPQVQKADWDEAQHPRLPAGSEHGGEFTHGGGNAMVSRAFQLTHRPAQTQGEHLAAAAYSPELQARIKVLEDEVHTLGLDIDPMPVERWVPMPEKGGATTDHPPEAERLKHTQESWLATLTAARDELAYLKDKFGIDFTRRGGFKIVIGLSASLPVGAGGETMFMTANPLNQVMGVPSHALVHLTNSHDDIMRELERDNKKLTVEYRKTDGSVEKVQAEAWTVAHRVATDEPTLLREIFRHELGHYMAENSNALGYISQHWFDKSDDKPKVPVETLQQLWVAQHLSVYASTTGDESNAEIFARFTQRGYEKGSMPEHYEALAQHMIDSMKTRKPRVRKFADLLGWAWYDPNYVIQDRPLWTVQIVARKEAGWEETEHPRGKTSPASTPGSFAPRGGPSTIDDIAKIPDLGKRRDAFMAMTREHRDALADPRKTIPDRIQELLGDDHPFTTLEGYVKSYANVLPESNQQTIIDMMGQMHGDMLAVGMKQETALQLTHMLTRYVIAQDYEAASRTLGDHGSYHLNGDMLMSKEILSILPTNVNTPMNRLLMDIVAATHDLGYLTPPSRDFLDLDHPRWGQQFFDEHLRPQIEQVLGKDFAAQASNLIVGHDRTIVDWFDAPEQSAFSTADNMALFHKEKMPPMLRHVPLNVDVLTRLGAGQIDVPTAKAMMENNIYKATHLTPELRDAFLHATSEVTGVLPKYTLGMVGTVYKGVRWDAQNNAVEISLERHKANEDLGKVVDFNAKQFHKLAETYQASGDELMKNGIVRFFNPITKKLVMIARLKHRLDKLEGFLAMLRERLWT